MLDFFQQRFAYIHQLNLNWVAHLRQDDRDLPWDIRWCISHLINAQHLLVCSILDKEAESDLNDMQPERYWEALERDNYRHWMEVFQQFNQGIQDNVEWLTPRLFQALHENAQYLGQLKLLLVQHGMEPIDETLIRVG